MNTYPPPPPASFSTARVWSAVLLVLVAAGTFAATWFLPWPVIPKNTPPSLPVGECIEALRKVAERQAAEKRSEQERETK